MFSSNYVDSTLPQTRQEWIEALQEEYNFTAEDYAANQHGQYSDRQKAVLEPIAHRSRNDPGCFIVLAGGLLAGALGVILLNMALEGVIAAFLSIYPNGLVAGLATLGFVGALILSAFSTMSMRSKINSMDKFVIKATEGPATVQRSWSAFATPQIAPLVGQQPYPRRRRDQLYHVTIGETRFYMIKPAAQRFLPGAVYRVYYLRFVYGIVFFLSADLIRMP